MWGFEPKKQDAIQKKAKKKAKRQGAEQTQQLKGSPKYHIMCGDLVPIWEYLE